MSGHGRRDALLSLVVAASFLPSAVRSQQAAYGRIQVTIAVVSASYEVRPLPLYSLQAIAIDDTASTFTFRTTLAGVISDSLPPRSYRLRAVNPATVGDSSYTWDVPFAVVLGTNSIELTNQNATVQFVGAGPSDEGKVYLAVRGGVFRVEAGLGHGSGFFADTLGGVVLTNAHVVEGSDDVTVVIDSLTRVRGRVLSHDEGSDVAVIQISPAACTSCPKLRLAAPSGRPLASPGERLLAIGFPLSQEQTLTAGIASSVREGAIISDVNINHGNSGGPLLNMRGEVIAINTFGEADQQGGPGVSGSIVITKAGVALDSARVRLPGLVAPSDSLLPMMPRTKWPLDALRSYADTMNPRRYRKFDDLSTGEFSVAIATPVTRMVEDAALEREVGRDRRRREEQAGVVGSQQWSQLKQIRDWAEYVGADFVPVVTVTIDPKMGETTGSALFRVLISPHSKATYKFNGDLRYARFYRNRVLVEPILGGHGPVPAYVDNQWVSLKDVADRGYYVFEMDMFAPDSAGIPPEIIVEIADLKHSDKNVCQVVPFEVSETIWNDFEPYLRATQPSLTFVRAGARNAKDDRRGRTKFLQDCDWGVY